MRINFIFLVLLLFPWSALSDDKLEKRDKEDYVFVATKRVVGVFGNGYFFFGYLGTDGNLVIRGSPIPSRQGVVFYTGPGFEDLLNNPQKPNEPVYEFRSGLLVMGNLHNDGSFVPLAGSTVITLERYLAEYRPKQSPRIYNLPGKIEKKR